MSFLLTALFLALVVGVLRGLSLAADCPAPRDRVATPQGSSGPAAVVRERHAA
jgi:hypothetical protein